MPFLEDYIPVIKYHGLAIGDNETATDVSGGTTCNRTAGVITTASLTTVLDAYTLTVTNSKVAAADIVFGSLANGSNSAGTPILTTLTPAAGSFVAIIANPSATALNGTLKLSFLVIKTAT